MARKFMPVSSILIGVDLVSIKGLPNTICLQEDITTGKCRTALKNALNGWKADVVLHDGSPNMGAAWLQDAYTQSDLVLKSLKLATEFLVPGGTFVTKVFRSADYNSLLYIFNQLFRKVDVTKPMASRNTSAEIYVVCQGYLKPDKIDPRLLDPKHVFQEVDGEKKKTDLFSNKKQRAHRDGYEAGNYTQFKRCSVARFIEAEDPIALLTEYNQFVFDDETKAYETHKDTSQEIRMCCEDLKVLNKSDFRDLLRWRLKVRNLLKIAKEEPKEEEKSDISVVDETELLNKQIEDRLLSIEAKEKKKRKKLREKKAKERRRVELGITNPAAFLESPETDTSLFALKNIKDEASLSQVTVDEALEMVVESSDSDSDDEELVKPGDTYEVALEKYLDELYGRYVERSRAKGKEVTGDARKKLAPDEEEADSLTATIEAPEEEEMIEEYRNENPLLIKEAVAPPPNQTELWFSQSVFEDVDEEDNQKTAPGDDIIDEDEEEEEEEVKPKKQKVDNKKAKQQETKNKKTENSAQKGAAKPKEQKPQPQQQDSKKRKRGTSMDEIEVPDKIPASNPVYDKHGLFPLAKKPAEAVQPKEKKPKMEEELSNRQKRVIEEHFDVVPIQREFSESESDESSDTDEYEESDVEDKAVTLAIGKKMITKKRKRKMEDDAYNRYAFGDADDLPKWFADDEKKHNQPQLPVTKEEVEEMKEKWKAINARPIKKVLEAKARKKHKSMKKMERMKKIAERIAKTGDLSEKEKIQSIQSLYKKMGAEKKPNTVYIVRKKFSGGKGPGSGKHSKVKIVDPRMKKDKLGMKRAETRKSGKKAPKKPARRHPRG